MTSQDTLIVTAQQSQKILAFSKFTTKILISYCQLSARHYDTSKTSTKERKKKQICRFSQYI
jgi:hypothetical protein